MKATTLLQVLKYLSDYDETEEAFLRPKGWETHFSPLAILDLKREFLDQGTTHTERARWRIGMFDSVTTHFVLGRHVIKNTIVTGVPKDMPFMVTLSCQTEAKYDCTYTRVSDWEIYQGASPMTECIAWREKLDGTPVVHVGSELCSCHLTSPWNVPYAGELTDTGLYQLYPYGSLVSGLDHELSEWRSFQEPMDGVREGVIMLSLSCTEYRVKRNPTIELADQEGHPGVWEFELLPDRLLNPIRPRTRRPAGNMARLAKVLPLDCLEVDSTMAIPIKILPVLKISEEAGAYHIPSFDNLQGHTTTYGDVDNEHVASDVHVSLVDFPQARNMVVGAKLLLKQGGTYYLFKDGQKKYDLIGGTIEPGETSRQTLDRELEEECPGLLKRLHITHLGAVQVSRWQTSLYLGVLKGKPPVEFVPFHFHLPYVEWAPRLFLIALGMEKRWLPRKFMSNQDSIVLCKDSRQGKTWVPLHAKDPTLRKLAPYIAACHRAIRQAGGVWSLSRLSEALRDVDVPDSLHPECLSFLLRHQDPALVSREPSLKDSILTVSE